MIFQMTGLPAAGKSTLAVLLKKYLEAIHLPVILIDGDVYRKTVCSDLGFSASDRRTNIRRLGSIANEYSGKGFIAVISAINPFEDIRIELKERYHAKTIWIYCPIDELIRRDPKGLYKRAFLPDSDPDKIRNLTGINDPFEIPACADLIIDTSQYDLIKSSHRLRQYVLSVMGMPV